METQNITLAVPKDILRTAKRLALDRQTSLSRLLVGLIESLVASENRYELAHQRHLALLDQGFDLGGEGRPLASREELHER